jgi:hypothetical protein
LRAISCVAGASGLAAPGVRGSLEAVLDLQSPGVDPQGTRDQPVGEQEFFGSSGPCR